VFPVAVLDTGINLAHPDLNTRVIKGRDFTFSPNDYLDGHGHGTHVAGIIAATVNNDIGMAGACPNCKLLVGKVLSDGGYGGIYNVVQGIDWAVEEGAKIINLSLGGGGVSLPLKDAILNARDNGVLVVAAAGNSHTNNDRRPHYPSSYASDNILSVASVQNDDKLSSFSNYGFRSVDVAAPGTRILSTWLRNGYRYLDGTSMATPLVTGIAALTWQSQKDATFGSVIASIKVGTVPLQDLQNKVASGGKVNALNSVQGSVGCPEPCEAGRFCRCIKKCSTSKCRKNCRVRFKCPQVNVSMAENGD
jgi:subtilisin family serine protease